MNPVTHQQAELCASKVSCIIGIAAAIEILYYAFEIWKNCPVASKAQSVLSKRYNEGTYTGAVMRRAMRTIDNGAARQDEALSEADTHNLTVAALDHWRTADDTTLATCLASPCSLIAGPYEDFTDDIH